MITVNSNIMITIITIDMFVVVHMFIILIIIRSSNVIVLRDCKDRRRGRAEQSGAHGSGHDPNSLPITTVPAEVRADCIFERCAHVPVRSECTLAVYYTSWYVV